MEKRFYLGLRPHCDGRYFIHREDCPLLPAPEKRIFLGKFFSPAAAAKNRQKPFNHAHYCSFCLKEYNQEVRNQISFVSAKDWKFASFSDVKPNYESIMMCGVN